ncbi:AMP nucleosidase [Pseudorhizobium banfieldiae]|uniref:AMP nucleosidase n=1 Tax=Pseudorhizobium banfieldiae TaxID=1125847 RepID=L0ND16_9HYPH|nr:AMP nucleosidase [Pseudorhizobium banfieldiae]CAD6603347.1 AMP nucleosidase [arsenite-oxidising bacterium NT-25]CCF18681.1 AMP nucleosidase [Pseudorhizobium banfieldiae]
MSKRIFSLSPLPFISPSPYETVVFDDPAEAVDALTELYERNTRFLIDAFGALANGSPVTGRYRACYPQVSIETTSFGHADSRLSYGHVTSPGIYTTTITRPKLFRHYLKEQLGLLMRNHNVPITVSESATPIPLHFAFGEGAHVEASATAGLADVSLRDLFDTPDLNNTDDLIANGEYDQVTGEPAPLAPFTAQRIDYSLARLSHYTATSAEHFQNFVLFTNYQFYIDEFAAWAREMMAKGGEGYDAFVEPGNLVTYPGEPREETALVGRLPQMPAYHLKKKGHAGITLVNIGVGPSNAKTITDHIAVLRPHAWLMVGHCAGLRNSQRLGDYVLAHAYVREDHVLDDDLPVWVPIPALAEVQQALEDAVEEVTGYEGFELKRIMRTGTVATIDNRNWELRDQRGPVKRLSQSRAIALDMESATIAANGFRFRVPYGTLLCVSDKPLHGELKLPGMATAFYRTQVSQHLQIGIRAVQKLAAMPVERLHSRKLRSFYETAFQ